MGLETSPSIVNAYGDYLHIFDNLVISVFTIEVILRIYAHRISFFQRWLESI